MATAPNNWKLVKQLFEAALDQDSSRRASFLRDRCSDAGIRAEVERLLVEHEEASSFLSTPPLEGLPGLIEAPCAARKLSEGQVLAGRYRIVCFVASGGMGVLYKAEDTRLHRPVALKFLPEQVDQNPHSLARFQREAQTASALNHPNICTIHDIGEHEGKTFIAMEFLEGTTLKKKLTEGPLDQNTLIELAIEIVDGLNAAHETGIIHRDIKPANIFLTNSGRVKILDFGLAKFTPVQQRDVALNASTISAHRNDSSDLTGPGAWIGTVSYMSPEQARGWELDNRTDLFSLGVVLYEMATGQQPFLGETAPVIFEAILNREPVAPSLLNPSVGAELERIIARTLSKDRTLRYQSAWEVKADLCQIAPDLTTAPAVLTVENHPTKLGEVALLYKRNSEPDQQILRIIEQELRKRGYPVFIDRHLQVGMEWAREIEHRISNAYAVIVLLSHSAVNSEMLSYEVQIAHNCAQKTGRPRLLPVRLNFDGALPADLAAILDGIQYAQWSGPKDTQSMIDEITESLRNEASAGAPRVHLETVGGAVPSESRFYIVRPTDGEFHEALSRKDSIILIKGARQMGKSSIMARGLQEARKAGCRIILTDFQKLNASHLESAENLFLALSDWIADQLDLNVVPSDSWSPRRGPSMNFERFLKREVLSTIPEPLVWGMDEVDRLFNCNFGSEVFGLFRSWHNERSLDPAGPWRKLTLAIAYATEAHMFITDINQSPFNVGTRLVLTDFTLMQVEELNRRYGGPLRDRLELIQFYDLVGGQPYLTRRGLHELASRSLSFRDLETRAAHDEGPFGDHLRRLLVSLAEDENLCKYVRAMLSRKPGAPVEVFYRLRSSGLVSGESAREMKPRCKLYELYLTRHLL